MNEAMKDINIRFIKVEPHTGVSGNESADSLAKMAVGLWLVFKPCLGITRARSKSIY